MIYSRKSKGITSAECARQRLQVHASARCCRSIKLNDERVVVVDKLDAESFDARHTYIRVIRGQGECALAVSQHERSSSCCDGVSDSWRIGITRRRVSIAVVIVLFAVEDIAIRV